MILLFWTFHLGEGIALRTVLLVLRSESFCYVMREAFQDHYHVIAAQDAASAAILLQKQPDILMLDLFLSGIDGLSFLMANRHLLPETVLLFTTLAVPQILQTASDLGVKAVFLKPCSLSAVLKRLKSYA